MYINTSTIGNIGESVAICEFMKKGIQVLLPFGQNVPYDLVIQINDSFYKIQCKTTKKVHNDTFMRFDICRTGFKGKRMLYTSQEIDYYFLYCIENNYIGLVPINDAIGLSDLILRISPPKNNQAIKIRYASDYSFDKQINNVQLINLVSWAI